MIRYKCSKCGAQLESDSSLAGQKDTCPICGAPCRVPLKSRSSRLPLYISGGGVGLALLIVAVAWLWPRGNESAEPPGEQLSPAPLAADPKAKAQPKPKPTPKVQPKPKPNPKVEPKAATKPATQAKVAEPPGTKPLPSVADLSRSPERWQEIVDFKTTLVIRPTDSGTPTLTGGRTHADWDLTATLIVSNPTSRAIRIHGAGKVVLDPFNLDCPPVSASTLGDVTIPANGTKKLTWKETPELRIGKTPFLTEYFYVPLVCTGTISIEGIKAPAVRAVCVFPRRHGQSTGKVEFWIMKRAFLQKKAGAKEEWISKLATALKEDL